MKDNSIDKKLIYSKNINPQDYTRLLPIFSRKSISCLGQSASVKEQESFLAGIFYFMNLNERIGINYLPDVFINNTILNRQLNENSSWEKGFLYFAKDRINNLERREFSILKSIFLVEQEVENKKNTSANNTNNPNNTNLYRIKP